jgi:hypothetical protein
VNVGISDSFSIPGWLEVSVNDFGGDMTDPPAFLREPPDLPRGGRRLDRDAAGFAQSTAFADNS